VKKAKKWSNPGEEPETETSSPERDDLLCKAAAEGFVLLKNQSNTLPISKEARVAVIGHHATMTNMSGGGSAKINPYPGITPLQGLIDSGFNTTYSRGVPVFNAVPLPEFEAVCPSQPTSHADEPVQVEWFNSVNPGTNLLRTTYHPRTDYMIKEVWPADLNKIEYSTRMTFNLTPKSSGEHLLAVTTTGDAKCYINGKLAFHREQDMNLDSESCKHYS
jgi:beta-glucosidase